MQGGATYRVDYVKPSYLTEKTDLTLVLSKKEVKVFAKHEITRAKETPIDTPFILHGRCLTLDSIRVNDVPLRAFVDYKLESDSDGNQTLTLFKPPKENFSIIIANKTIPPSENKSLQGLFLSGDTIVSHCENEGYRRITFSQDRPDIMPIMRTTIEANKTDFPVVLSNGVREREVNVPGNIAMITYSDPNKKPTYLFALVAGPLFVLEDEYIAKNGEKTHLAIFMENEKDRSRCYTAMRYLKEAMRFYEEKYHYRYGKEYKIVGVKDFNAGAMENTGLNIFALNELIADYSITPFEGKPSFVRTLTVVAHELAHHRAGNLVTVQNWFELALKEGLASKMEAECSSHINGADITRIRNIKALLAHQFPEDAGPTAHKVHPAGGLPANFYTPTTYFKGAELLGALEYWLGEEAWNVGVNWYLDKHNGQAATIQDFLTAIREKTVISAEKFEQFERWYHKAGTPEIAIEKHYNEQAKTYTLTFSQLALSNKGPIKKPFLIPFKMGLLARNGKELTLQLAGEQKPSGTTRVLEVSELKQSFTFVNVEQEPVLSWRDFSAPIKIVKSPLSFEDRLLLLAHDTNTVSRWFCAKETALIVLKNAIEKLSKGESLPALSPEYSEALRAILMSPLPPQLIAMLLELPSEKEALNYVPGANPVVVSQAHAWLGEQLANALQENLSQTYDNQCPGIAVPPEATSTFASLRNYCLTELLRCKKDNDKALSRCVDQFNTARTITETLGALTPLFVLTPPEGCAENWLRCRKEMLQKFYKKYQHEPLVINQWFRLQALSRSAGVVDELRDLIKDEKFDLSNPANVRNTLIAFADSNPLFHQENGAGYKFIAEIVLKLDKEVKNADVAVQLLRPMVSCMQMLDAKRQAIIRAELARLQSANVSDPVMELVNKGLNPATSAVKKEEALDVSVVVKSMETLPNQVAVNQLRLLSAYLKTPGLDAQREKAKTELSDVLVRFSGDAKAKLPKNLRKGMKTLVKELEGSSEQQIAEGLSKMGV